MDRIKIFSILAFSFLVVLFSCKKEADTEKTEPTQAVEETPTESWNTQISLDKGEKWLANKETTTGIENMKILIENSSPATPGDYRELGSALNEEKNLLLKRCTMKGPSHDNLHIYLQPLLMQIAALQETTSAEAGKKTVEKINQHLEEYHNFFM